MQNPTTNIQEMIKELNRFQLPSSLMESFDTWREDAARAVSQEFSPSQLNWFLDLLNRFRGPEDRKDSLLEFFDPGMYTSNHPAWEAAPGTEIELPALTSEVAGSAGDDSEFAEIAREEIRDFRELARSFADEEIAGLAKIAGKVIRPCPRTIFSLHCCGSFDFRLPHLFRTTWSLPGVNNFFLARGTSSVHRSIRVGIPNLSWTVAYSPRTIWVWHPLQVTCGRAAAIST